MLAADMESIQAKAAQLFWELEHSQYNVAAGRR
jgi:hypothetical protein